jgi:LacI family transcriptional regulator
VSTIKDVARQAGVSIATVSRAYNGSPLVNETTARRVLEVAGRLDYWPNSAARSLSTCRTQVVGVLLPDLFGEFFSEVIRGIDHAARRAGYQILVSCSHADTRELLAAVRSMRGRIDGLIAMSPTRDSVDAVREISRYFPLVLLNPAVPVGGCPALSIANYEGAHAMVKHLVGLGHRRIAMIRGPAGNVDADERLRGYRAALNDARLPAARELEFAGDFTESAGYSLAEKILALRPRPTAVFAANDYLAIGLMSALRDAGVGVPTEVAVCGFDDIAMARFMSPPLTTVRVDAYGLGQSSVQQWLATVRGAAAGVPAPVTVTIPTAVVLRGSCAPPPPARAKAAAPPASAAKAASERTAHANASPAPAVRARTRRATSTSNPKSSKTRIKGGNRP